MKIVSAISKQDFLEVQRGSARPPMPRGGTGETLALPPKNKFAPEEVVVVHVPDEKWIYCMLRLSLCHSLAKAAPVFDGFKVRNLSMKFVTVLL